MKALADLIGPTKRRSLAHTTRTGWLWLLAGAFGLGAAFAGCGPSVQSIYEGKVRFEHCYRLDLDNRITVGHREACWNQWIATYSYGQPRDRLEYARLRVRSLKAGDPNPPRLNLDRRQGPSQRQFYLSVPAPTSAHSPPPPIATRVYETSEQPPEEAAPQGAKPDKTPLDSTAPGSPPPGGEAPGDECLTQCRTARKQCLEGPCAHKGKSSEEPCHCDGPYKSCVRDCVK